MRKLTSWILCVLLLTALVIPASAAGGTFKITPSATEVTAGQEVTLTVDVVNGEACNSFGVVVKYDTNVFELVSIDSDGGGFKYPHVSDPREAGFSSNPYPGVGGWNTEPASGFTPSQSSAVPTGKVGTVTLKVKDGAALGDTKIEGEASADGTTLSGAVAPVTVKVVEKAAGGLLGDADSNGVVNSNDAMLVLQYSISMPVELNTAVCDVDGNGVINSNDAMLILQYSINLITKFPASN